MAAVAAALGAIGQKVLNLMGVFWLIEEVVQRIQVAQMIQQRQQMIQARKKEKSPPNFLKSWSWTVAPGTAPGVYTYSIGLTTNVPTEPSGFYRHPYLVANFTVIGGAPPPPMYLKTVDFHIVAPTWSRHSTFSAKEADSGASMEFEAPKATHPCLFVVLNYEGDAPKADIPTSRRTGEAVGIGAGCGGKWMADEVVVEYAAGKVYYTHVHACEIPIGEDEFEIADALFLQDRINALIAERDNLKAQLKDLGNQAERIARLYEREEFPDWYIKRIYDSVYLRYQDLVEAWKENTDALASLIDMLRRIAPEDALKLKEALRSPKPIPTWEQLKQLAPRPDPTPHLNRVKIQIQEYSSAMSGYYAKAKGAAHKALAAIWDVGYDELKAYSKAQTDAEKIAIAERLLQKLPAEFWNHIGDMYLYLARYNGAKSKRDELDAYLRWYSGESVVISELDVELVSQILREVTGA
jgi:hypothetical protein